MNLCLRESRNDVGKRSYIGMISYQDVDKSFNDSAFILADQKGCINMVNEATLKMFGYSAKEIVGKV